MCFLFLFVIYIGIHHICSQSFAKSCTRKERRHFAWFLFYCFAIFIYLTAMRCLNGKFRLLHFFRFSKSNFEFYCKQQQRNNNKLAFDKVMRATVALSEAKVTPASTLKPCLHTGCEAAYVCAAMTQLLYLYKSKMLSSIKLNIKWKQILHIVCAFVTWPPILHRFLFACFVCSAHCYQRQHMLLNR